ncbi:MAG TPA: type II toxin-antitoxin system VapC family toxin [Gemmataceae bacterium]|nr:type II toxin-antitoxin system VapC family toxin [Gemmataceae bacterium]
MRGPWGRSLLTNPTNTLFFSAASMWEIAIKVGIGKLILADPYDVFMNQAISTTGLTILPIEVRNAAVLTALPRHHGDPFDRMLIAQALVETMPLVSADAVFDAYGVTRLW